jgi:hypothetical protein
MGLTAMGVMSMGLTETAACGGVGQQQLQTMEVWWLRIDSFLVCGVCVCWLPVTNELL